MCGLWWMNIIPLRLSLGTCTGFLLGGGGGGKRGHLPPLKKVLSPLSQRDLPHILPDVFMLPPKISHMCNLPPLVKLSDLMYVHVHVSPC